MSSTVYTLLIVDDEPYLLPTLSRLLEREVRVLTASCAKTAQEHFAREKIDIILTDQRMPQRTGAQLLEWVRENSPETIRLLMTGYSELEDAVEAINRGQVYYYLRKPWRTEELLQVLRNAIEKVRLQQERENLIGELQALNSQLEQRVRERTAELEQANVLLKDHARQLEDLARTDELTGLQNRRAIAEIATQEIERHRRYPAPFAMGIIDVDHFKDVNTQFLLTGGDAVLRGLAAVLDNCVRGADTIGRLGGEEFMVIAPETTFAGAEKLAERIRSTVEASPIRYRNEAISITVSAGFIVVEGGTDIDFDTLHHLASDAMREAKNGGRNRCVIRPSNIIEGIPTPSGTY